VRLKARKLMLWSNFRSSVLRYVADSSDSTRAQIRQDVGIADKFVMNISAVRRHAASELVSSSCCCCRWWMRTIYTKVQRYRTAILSLRIEDQNHIVRSTVGKRSYEISDSNAGVKAESQMLIEEMNEKTGGRERWYLDIIAPRLLYWRGGNARGTVLQYVTLWLGPSSQNGPIYFK